MKKIVIAILIGLLLSIPLLVWAATEDFTTWTEVDPNNRIATTSARVTFTALSQDEDAYVYKDFTAGYFDGDFEHWITLYVDGDADTSYFPTAWTLANLVDDLYGIWYGVSDDALFLSIKEVGTVITLRFYEVVAGNGLNDDSINLSEDTLYYLKIERDEAVGDYGTLYCYIYDDSGRTSLVDTLTLTLREKENFRYLYVAQTYDNDTATMRQTGYVENLYLEPPVAARRRLFK